MREAEQIVQRLLEDDPTEFIDRQRDLLLLTELVRRKFRPVRVRDHFEFTHDLVDDGREVRITLFVTKSGDDVSVTAGGAKNFEDDLQNDNWVDYEIDPEWILKPTDDIGEFVDGLLDDLSSHRGPDEEPEVFPDDDDRDD